MIDARLALRVAAVVLAAGCLWLIVGELEARQRSRAASERWRRGERERLRQLAAELAARVEALP